jgi:hypothetical protein
MFLSKEYDGRVDLVASDKQLKGVAHLIADKS